MRPIFNKIIQTVELFYDENKAMNTPHIKINMLLVMNLYVGKENDYKAFVINHIKDIFGIVEDTNTNIGQDE